MLWIDPISRFLCARCSKKANQSKYHLWHLRENSDTHSPSDPPCQILANNIQYFLPTLFSENTLKTLEIPTREIVFSESIFSIGFLLQECASPGCGCGLINSAVYQKMITIADKQAERDRYFEFWSLQQCLLPIERIFARCCYILCCCPSSDPATAAGCASSSSQGSSSRQQQSSCSSSLGTSQAGGGEGGGGGGGGGNCSNQASRQSARDQPTACIACTGFPPSQILLKNGWVGGWHTTCPVRICDPFIRLLWSGSDFQKILRFMWNFFCLSFCVFVYKMAIHAQHGHLAFGP